jgi:hypothetical protein
MFIISEVTSIAQLDYQKFQIPFIWIEEHCYYISTEVKVCRIPQGHKKKQKLQGA